MRSGRTIRAVCLILLLCGSFFLHTFVHHSACCGAVSHLSARNNSGNSIHHADCTEVSVEFFCPVCAGMMNADEPPAETGFPLVIGNQDISAFFSELLSTPDWLRPSPRGPPAPFLRFG